MPCSPPVRRWRPRGPPRLGDLVRSAGDRSAHPGAPRLTNDYADTSLTMPTVWRREPYIHFDRDAGGRICSRAPAPRGGSRCRTAAKGTRGCSVSRERHISRTFLHMPATLGPGAMTGERNLLPFIPWLAQRGARSRPSRARTTWRRSASTRPTNCSRSKRSFSQRGTAVTLSIVIPAYNEERVHRHPARSDPGRRSESLRARQGDHRRRRRVERLDRGDCRRAARRSSWCGRPRTAARAAAVRAGIARATGDYLIIQDADLEYDPHDYVPMLRGAARSARRHRLRQPLPARRQGPRISPGPPTSADAA